MTFALPQLIYLALMALGVGVSLARFGEQKRDRYDVVDVFIAPGLALTLLWWGGFFGG